MSDEKITYKHPQKHYAALYNRSVRTIREYQNVSAPLDDESAMKTWLNRKATGNIPRVKLPVASAAEIGEKNQGAGPALKRLEQEEAGASAVFDKAKEAGDTH